MPFFREVGEGQEIETSEFSISSSFLVYSSRGTKSSDDMNVRVVHQVERNDDPSVKHRESGQNQASSQSVRTYNPLKNRR